MRQLTQMYLTTNKHNTTLDKWIKTLKIHALPNLLWCSIFTVSIMIVLEVFVCIFLEDFCHAEITFT